MTDAREQVLALLREHGWNTTSFQVLERGFVYWFDSEGPACVAYVDTGSAWVVAGAPIAERDGLAGCGQRFVEAARKARRRVCFFAVEDRFVEVAQMESMPIGTQPSWDPAAWEDTVRKDRRLREQLNRARAKGVSTRPLAGREIADADASIRPRIEQIVARWQATRKMAPMGFIVDVQPYDLAVERRYFIAERDGEPVGLLVAVPVYRRNGWLFEDLLRLDVAPNGTTELLFDTAMRAVAAEGSGYVTMGLAPLAGDVHAGLRFLRALGSALYDFDGVRRFKAKLRPDAWSTIHLAWPTEQSGNVAMVDSLAAFTMRGRDGHDRASFVRFGFETLAHAPAFAVRLLSLALVPWTLAIALVPTAWFFPSRAVQLAWVVWDIALVVAMLSLASRWRQGLARALAVATLLDATLTTVEVIVDGVYRAHTVIDFVVLVVACVGPLLATSLLWGALARRRSTGGSSGTAGLPSSTASSSPARSGGGR